MDFVSSTLSGVVGGLIATLICVVFSSFWIRVLELWFEERVYKEVHIEGRWNSTYIFDGVVRKGIWEVHRIGHTVKVLVTRIEGPKAGSSWHYVGTFKNLILTATY